MKLLEFIYLSLFVLLVSCGVKEASVSGNPPQLEKVVLKAGSLKGSFVSTETPKIFLWPTTSEQGMPLSLEEQILKRTEIFKKAEIQTQTEKSVKGKVIEIQKESQKIIDDLVAIFVGKECGRLADDIFEDPDPASTTVDEWKVPETEEEELEIASCQANLDERDVQINEADEKSAPLKKKALEATISLLDSIGSENFFNGVEGLDFEFGEKNIVLLKGFEETDYSSESTDEKTLISDVKVDKLEGLVSFSIPAFSKKDPATTIGKYIFDFEVTLGGEKTKLDGEIRLIALDGIVKTGRATFEGDLK